MQKKVSCQVLRLIWKNQRMKQKVMSKCCMPKKLSRPAGIFLVMAFVEKLNPLNYNLTL